MTRTTAHTFPTFHHDHGRWAKGWPEKVVPYRLPELLAAPVNEAVWICEGEKDADNIATLGLTATTNPGGAQKFQSELVEHLFMGGRGAGKSHATSAAVHMAVRAGLTRIHVVAPTTSDFHDVNLEGRSGILATCGRDPRPRWISSRRRLEWKNGVSSLAKSPRACAVHNASFVS